MVLTRVAISVIIADRLDRNDLRRIAGNACPSIQDLKDPFFAVISCVCSDICHAGEQVRITFA